LKDIQYVDLFPDWNAGLEKVLGVLRASAKKTASTENKEPIGYQYRCGIVDLDLGLTNLPAVAQRLNSIQRFFHFTSPTLYAKPQALITVGGLQNFLVSTVPQSFYAHKQYMNVDLAACLTQYPLAFKEGDSLLYNYFSGPSATDERFMFISAHMLYDFAKKAGRTFEKGLVYIIVSQLLVYFTDLGYHEETRSCVMDFCRIRSEMVEGLLAMRFCPRCLPQIQDPNIKDAVLAILADEMRV